MPHQTALVFQGKIRGTWTTLGVQYAGSPPATISDNGENNRRDVYVTECFADHATIRRLPGGVDAEYGIHRIIDREELQRGELVKRLAIGESIEMTLKPDRAPIPREVRYRCVSSDNAQMPRSH